MRVSGASHGLNSRQNDKRAQKRKKRGRGRPPAAGNTGGGALEVNDRKHRTSREVERLIERSRAAGTRSATVACCSNPVANGIDLSLMEHVSPIEWDNVVLYGQYILDRKRVRQRKKTAVLRSQFPERFELAFSSSIQAKSCEALIRWFK